MLAKRASELDLTVTQLSTLRSRVSELETQLESSRRECCKSQELNAKLQFDLHEVQLSIILIDTQWQPGACDITAVYDTVHFIL